MENENDKRASRAAESRSKSERPKVWQRSNNLDTPPAKDGYRYKWIRAEVQGYQDTRNVTGKLREGYELVRADEFPDYPVVDDGRYKGIIGVGGLLLARIPEEIAEQRNAYYRQMHDEKSEAIDNDLKKEQHRSMPINIDRQTSTTFGGSKKS
mgnify:CR=1 FL=1|jgi:hypothetical protein